MTHNRHMRRLAYTLVELLVVMFIMLALAGLAVLVIPKVTSDQTATRAGTQVQQWLEIVKNRAARDRAQRGLRLLPGNPASPLASALLVTDVEFLEQPDDYHLGNLEATVAGIKYLFRSRATVGSRVINGVATATVQFDFFPQPIDRVGAALPAPITLIARFPRTLTGLRQPTNPTPNVVALFPVQAGDSIIFNEAGPAYKIIGVTSQNAAPPNNNIANRELTLATAPPPGLITMQYRILRKPRTVGDEPLQLPANTVIDLNDKNAGYDLRTFILNNNNPNTPKDGLDIMFAPDGRVMGAMAGQDKIILWVRDVTAKVNEGGPTLVCVYTRTGLIAAHEVDTAGYPDINGNFPFPYTFTVTGRR